MIFATMIITSISGCPFMETFPPRKFPIRLVDDCPATRAGQVKIYGLYGLQRKDDNVSSIQFEASLDSLTAAALAKRIYLTSGKRAFHFQLSEVQPDESGSRRYEADLRELTPVSSISIHFVQSEDTCHSPLLSTGETMN